MPLSLPGFATAESLWGRFSTRGRLAIGPNGRVSNPTRDAIGPRIFGMLSKSANAKWDWAPHPRRSPAPLIASNKSVTIAPGRISCN